MTWRNRSYATFPRVFIVTSEPASQSRPLAAPALAGVTAGLGGRAGSELTRSPRPSTAGPAPPLRGCGSRDRGGPARTSAARGTLPSLGTSCAVTGRALRGAPRAHRVRARGGARPAGSRHPSASCFPAPRRQRAPQAGREQGSRAPPPPAPSPGRGPTAAGGRNLRTPPCPGPASAARGGGVTQREGTARGGAAGGRGLWGKGAAGPGLVLRPSFGGAAAECGTAFSGMHVLREAFPPRPSQPLAGDETALPASPRNRWLPGAGMGGFEGQVRKRNLWKV